MTITELSPDIDLDGVGEEQIGFVFDLDGTVTSIELLPLIAKSTNIADEMTALTAATIAGSVPFDASFRMRCQMLADIPISQVQEIVSTAALDQHIVEFILSRPDQCAIATGNLDVWIQPLLDRLGCRSFTSTALTDGDRLIEVDDTVDKAAAVDVMRRSVDVVVAIGDGMNDVAMFEAADISVAFGGVHRPAVSAREAADFVTMNGGGLCQLLISL